MNSFRIAKSAKYGPPRKLPVIWYRYLHLSSDGEFHIILQPVNSFRIAKSAKYGPPRKLPVIWYRYLHLSSDGEFHINDHMYRKEESYAEILIVRIVR